MEDFPTLYSFMIFTKGWTYVLMGVARPRFPLVIPRDCQHIGGQHA